MRKRILIFIALLLLFLAGCAGKDAAPATTGSEASEESPFQFAHETETGATETGTTGALREFDITAYQFGFEPDRIEVNTGDRVRLTLTSSDVAHGFSIPEFGVNMFAQNGKSDTAEFVAKTQGSYPFFCSVYCGAGHGGMSGVLIVK